MSEQLKKGVPPGDAAVNNDGVEETVRKMLAEVAAGGEEACLRYARQFDGLADAGSSAEAASAPPVSPDSFSPLLPPEVIAEALEGVPAELREAIDFAHARIAKFARAQRASMLDTRVELSPGCWAGSRYTPVGTVGCYVPGGRYAHIASALMTVTTARAAGVPRVVACSPPRTTLPSGQRTPHPAVLYALSAAGADHILCLGGVQGVAALAYGLFLPAPAGGAEGERGADVLCGPGNRFVVAAKRQLFGERGIDLIAGPTEACVLADGTADAGLVAVDLVSQLEHGPDSPCVAITTSRALGEAVVAAIPPLIAQLPEPNRSVATQAWRDYGEVHVCGSREEAACLSDRIASEHVEVHCADLWWWLGRLRNYGSLFLGTHTTVTMGDKAFGPNHTLPTRRAARYTGGLYVGSFLKCLSWQACSSEGATATAAVSSQISRAEGMEGHARASDVRCAASPPERAGHEDRDGNESLRFIASLGSAPAPI